MARSRRITRREMKEDKFILLLYSVSDYITHHVQEVLIGAGVVVIALVAGVLYGNARQSADEDAARLLAPAQTAMQNNRAEDALPIYERILNDYGGSSSARETTLGLANANFQMGDIPKARQYFQMYISEYSPGLTTSLWSTLPGTVNSVDVVLVSAEAGLAACLEQETRYSEAAIEYRRLAEAYPDLFLAPQFCLDAGRCFQAADQTSEAKSMYDRVISEYKDSRYATDARTALTTL